MQHIRLVVKARKPVSCYFSSIKLRSRPLTERPVGSFVSRCFSTASNGGEAVYSWGTGDEGQLGHTDIVKSGLTNTYVELSPVRIETLPKSKKFIDVASGVSHAAAITTDGELYTWGDCEYGKLGHKNVTNSSNGKKLCLLPTKVEFPKNEPIKQVVCGEFHTAALTTDGNLYTWGWGGSTWSGVGCLGHGSTDSFDAPKKVLFPDEAIKLTSISTGKYHMAGVGEGGEVWSWGRGEYGRIGNGSNSDELYPIPVEYFLDLDLTIKQVACGSNFTMALSDDGKVYGWGSNDNCQLGLGGGFAVDMFSMEHYPKLVDALEKETISFINAGVHHAVGITSSGEVYAWGMKMWFEPQKLSTLASYNIVKASCGNNFTVALDDAGQMFSWGKGMMMRNSGVLGLGHTKRTVQPELIETMASTPIQIVSAGSKSVLALSGLPKKA